MENVFCPNNIDSFFLQIFDQLYSIYMLPFLGKLVTWQLRADGKDNGTTIRVLCAPKNNFNHNKLLLGLKIILF
jgi:hypothetical protein